MASQSQVEYGIFTVPRAYGEEGKIVASKFRLLRLQALKESPEAWLSTYEKEVDVPSDDWLAYLRNPRRTVFVCVAKPAAASRAPSLLQDEWVGMIQLIGPTPTAAWGWPRATSLHDDDEELRYHVTGAFVRSGHRRQQPPILARLIWLYNDWQVARARELLHQYRVENKSITKIYCRQRSVLTPNTLHLRRFYERLGTVHYGFVTSADEFKANEDKVPLPPKTEETRDFYEDPNMTAFEKIIEVTETTVWPEGVLLSQGPWLGSHEQRYGDEPEPKSAIPVKQIAKVAKL